MSLNLFSAFLPAARPAAPAAMTPRVVASPEAPRAAPTPARSVVGRREFHEMLWLPVVAVRDDLKIVVSAKAGLPHCLRCETPLTLESLPREQWRCSGCGQSRPGAEADFYVLECVVASELQEFFAAHEGYRPAPELSAPKRAYELPAV